MTFERLICESPETKIMGERKPAKFKFATAIIDLDDILCITEISFSENNQIDVEMEQFCKKNNIALCNLEFKSNSRISGIIVPNMHIWGKSCL